MFVKMPQRYEQPLRRLGGWWAQGGKGGRWLCEDEGEIHQKKGDEAPQIESKNKKELALV